MIAGVQVAVTPQAPAGPILARLYVAAASVLLVLTVRTGALPDVPPLSTMPSVTARATKLHEECVTSGQYAKTTTCYWDLSLDDGSRLDWPWPVHPGSGRKRVEQYLREAGPLTIHHWRGRIFQIGVRGGSVYISYADAASSERDRQWFWLASGVVVAAAGLIRIGVEVRRLARRDDSPSADWVDGLGWACGLGAPVLLIFGSRTWWPVLALAALAIVAEPLDRRLSRLRPAGA
jgi:hypothetical protein